MITNRFPYYAHSEEELIQRVQSSMPDLSLVKDVCAKAGELLEKIFVYEAEERLTADQLLNLDFFNDQL